MKYLITGRGITRKADTVDGLIRIATGLAEKEGIVYRPTDRAVSRLEWALDLLITGAGFKVLVSR